MATHLEPDILEFEVKWALGSITTNKASGSDGIPVEIFKILVDDEPLGKPTKWMAKKSIKIYSLSVICKEQNNS